jgi:hypothetical protein
MFEYNFNPEFHWQMDQKKTTRKKVLFIFVVLILLLSVFFIFKKYYFVSGRNISLEQLVPENVKALLTINTNDVIKNEKGSLIFKEGLKDFLKEDEKVDAFVKSIVKDIYWMEKSPDSQTFLFKMTDIELVKDHFNNIAGNSESIGFNNQVIYKSDIENTDNIFLPVLDNKIYITYLNDYIFCISNDLDSTKDIINKYKEAKKIDYFGAIKDELSGYFQEQTTLMLKVLDYPEIEDSSSWIKNLSFITQGDRKDSFILKFKVGLKRAELLFNDSDDISQRVRMNKVDGNLFDDALLHYSNLSLNYSDSLDLGDNLNKFLQNNIEGLYNTNFKSKLLSSSPYHILAYSNNKFLTLSKDFEKMKSVYQNILAHLSPQTRTMILPDGTSAIEYYADVSNLELKEQEENSFVKYYVDLPVNTDIYLYQYNNWYILTNFKEKLIELSENQNKFCELVNCNAQDSFNEVLTLNIDSLEQRGYLPWLSIFSRSYNRLNFTNFTENGENKLFFELIH